MTSTGGKANYLTGASTILDPVVYQTGTGSATRIGINTSTPAPTLDVKGTAIVRSTLNLPAAGTATAAAGAGENTLFGRGEKCENQEQRRSTRHISCQGGQLMERTFHQRVLISREEEARARLGRAGCASASR